MLARPSDHQDQLSSGSRKNQVSKYNPIYKLGILDQCNTKIGLIKCMWVSDLYFLVE